MHDPSPPQRSLAEILESVWTSLAEAVVHARDPFHTPTVGSTREGIARLRTVVLRFADRDTSELGFHTDARSLKRADLDLSPHLTWHFYDRERKVQLRMLGLASIHTDGPVADNAWASVTPLGRRCYGQGPAPGTAVQGPDVPLPTVRALEADDAPTLSQCREHFCVVRCHLTDIDWLHLRFRGHHRARFTRNGTDWSGHWIAP